MTPVRWSAREHCSNQWSVQRVLKRSQKNPAHGLPHPPAPPVTARYNQLEWVPDGFLYKYEDPEFPIPYWTGHFPEFQTHISTAVSAVQEAPEAGSVESERKQGII